MREHQIVINLNTEQFEEVQRLARSQGSTSVGLFVRQKLLATLGLSRKKATEKALDLKYLTGELRRIHRELQIFLVESQPTIPTYPKPVEQNFLTDGAPLLPEPSRPASGQMFPSQVLPYSMPLQSQLGLSKPLPFFTPSLTPDVPLSFPSGDADASQSDHMDSLAEVGSETEAYTDVDDNMEELAERAFAISPRLGPLEQPSAGVKAFPDPLNDLLEKALTEGLDAALEQVEEELAQTDKRSESEDPFEYKEEADLEEYPQEEFEEVPPAELHDDEPEAEPEDELDYGSPPPANQPPIPPNLSGGPPPRKRPT